MADTPLLDLNTLITRPAIVIDGERYELFSADELPVLMSHSLSVWGRRIEQLDASLSENDGAELAELVDKAAKAAVVDLPADVFEKLPGTQRRKIVDVFTGLLLRNRVQAVEAMAKAMGGPWIGEKSSPDSSDFSEDRPTGGWWKRLVHWFGRI